MNKFKQIIILLILITIMLGVSGCMKAVNNKVSEKDEMMAHMKNKYGEEFEFVNIGGEVWTANYTEMIVYSQFFPGKRIVVQRNYKTGIISDNYVALLLNDDIEKTFSEIVSRVYGKNVVINVPEENNFPSNFDRTTTVDEYAKNIHSGVDLNIFIERDIKNREQDVEKLRTILASKEYSICFRVFYLKPNTITMINRSNYSNYTKPNNNRVIVRGGFVMDKSFRFTFKKWGALNE